MKETRGHLTLYLDLSEPIEIEEFANLFAGLGSLFDDYLREEHPSLRGSARLYVREVRGGSIIADLVPSIPDLIGIMDSALIVIGFAALFSRRVRSFISGQGFEGATKSDLKHTMDIVGVVATDPDGEATLETVVYEEDGPKKRVEITFTSTEARRAAATIEAQKQALNRREAADHERVLLSFERPSIAPGQVGKRTGERAKIEAINHRALPIVYASELAEEQIKDRFRTGTDNVFRQAFDVDVNVETKEGRPIAYRITALHDVIDLPEDD